ncbi:MAG TPA: FliH/SctL family protein [Terracidiphilus sp.]|nr:FliH/SctL family protein [Terracidiphilus sp.]
MRAASAPTIEVFEYPAGADSGLPGWDGYVDAGLGENGVSWGGESPHRTAEREEALRARVEQAAAEASRQSYEAGRKQGIDEGRFAEREAHSAVQSEADRKRTVQAAELLEQFAQERNRYLHAVEHEVVELALAVAARILRREAQMDPLLLTGAVRVALGQLSRTTQVRLRVPTEDLELWTETIAHLPNLSLKPEVVAGEQMEAGDCAIETELGTVDLGIRAQLGEIERGFFDRTRARKAEPAGSVEGRAAAHKGGA